ncbi:helix-turn-helix domain-containing protein [Streptomyces sp. 549]|uniref:PucR family transcriptional regulator n=1 Tax=Streptomyces sp. 549 TaxID=3049076 RepID=UPI0024C2F0CF|nr:helix-turn-helix domain-containing protein [Streptomyces sp. 549]MDK1472155.1 helix-turn-helix domain-containing protein [Streptomyces sp. 549]
MSVRKPRTQKERRLVARAARTLLEQVPKLTDQLVTDLNEHSSMYCQVIAPDEQWESVSNAMRLGIAVLADPVNAPRHDLELAERTGRRRAEQGLPLDLLVHAYRHAGYVTWDALLDTATGQGPESLSAVTRAATAMWATVDRQAATAADAYRATEQEMLRRTDERVQALLDALLAGQTAPGLVQRASAALDLPEQGRYAVVALRAERHVGQAPFHRIPAADGMAFTWRMRTDYEVAVVALGESAGLDELAAVLAERCPGPGGISPVVGGLDELGRARRLAEVALRTCGPDTERSLPLVERLPTALVVSQPELAGLLVADVFGPLLELEASDRALLLETLDAWLESRASAGRAATRLFCHRNTVFNRLRRLEQLTSRSLSHPRDLTEMTLALDAFRLAEAGM